MMSYRRVFLMILIVFPNLLFSTVATIECFLFLSPPGTVSEIHSAGNPSEQTIDSSFSPYQWVSKEQAIHNIRQALKKYRPSLLERYDRLSELTPIEVGSFKNEIYQITFGHFQVWELSGAMDQRSAPYFQGSYIEALGQVFSSLALNSLGFQLDWSNETRGIESVRYVLSKEVPSLMEQYDRFSELTPIEVESLKDEIYQIRQGHFNVWGLSRTMDQRSAPYSQGSHTETLLRVFSDPRLGLQKEGFSQNSPTSSFNSREEVLLTPL